MMRFVVHILLFIILTIITQVGGIVYMLSTFLMRNTSYNQLKKLGVLICLYSFCSFLLVPNIAPFFGREKIKNTHYVKAHNFITILCNRNYVTPKLQANIQEIGKKLNRIYPELQLVYLDANFPFLNGFPLLPHLSHHDGRKLDISFIYQTNAGLLTNQKPSVSGYGVFEGPTASEQNTTLFCKKKGYWQYDFTKFLTFGTSKDIRFANKATKKLLKILVQSPSIKKIFIEPHLKNRLGLTSKKIRFHGCKAVRHDDHIHLQVTP